MNLGSKTVLVCDRGLYSFLAERLAEDFGKVLYYMDCSSPYPESQKAQIGRGLPGIESVEDFWPHVDKADLLCFFDVNDGALVDFLRAHGYRVFGAGGAERLELDKAWFLEQAAKAGLPVPHTWRAEGLDELERYLEQCRDERWLKTSYYRGDFETQKFRGMKHLRPWLADLRHRIGERRAGEIEILCQAPVEASCEVGYDGFCIDGAFTPGLAGYEMKDKGLVGKWMEETPPILRRVNEAMAPLFSKMGYRGHFSTEVRITEKGAPYFIDPTCRAPSPPSELLCEMIGNYPNVVWDISGGEVPEIKVKAPYGAEIVLSSPWHEQHELCVDVPEDLARWVKLKNVTRRQGTTYAVPNGNGGIFGAVVGLGKTMEEATTKALAYVQELDVMEMVWDETIFDDAAQAVQCGKPYGIAF